MQSGSALNHIHKLYTFQSVLSSFQSFNVGAYPQTRSQEFLVPLILRTGDVDVEWKVGGVGRRLWRGEVEGIHGWGWWKTMKGEVEGRSADLQILHSTSQHNWMGQMVTMRATQIVTMSATVEAWIWQPQVTSEQQDVSAPASWDRSGYLWIGSFEPTE